MSAICMWGLGVVLGTGLEVVPGGTQGSPSHSWKKQVWGYNSEGEEQGVISIGCGGLRGEREGRLGRGRGVLGRGRKPLGSIEAILRWERGGRLAAE